MKYWLVMLLLVLLVPFVYSAQPDNPGLPGGIPSFIERVKYVEDILEPEIKVMATDYVFGDDAKVFVQLLNGTGQPEDNATCFLKAWYPNSTRFLGTIDGRIMDYLEDGIYYYDFVIPEVEGVYPVSIKCSYLGVPDRAFPDNYFPYPDLEVNGDLIYLEEIDGVEMSFKEKGGDNDRRLKVNFSIPVSHIPTTADAINLKAVVRYPRIIDANEPLSDPLRYYLYNFSGGSDLLFGFHDYTTGLSFDTGLIYNITDYYNGSHYLVVIDDTYNKDTVPKDDKETTLFIDYGLFNHIAFSENQYQENIRGAGELNVKQTFVVPDFELSFGLSPDWIVWLLWLFLLVGLFFVDTPGYWLFVSMYSVIFGVIVVSGYGFWIGAVIVGIGGAFAVVGYNKVNR